MSENERANVCRYDEWRRTVNQDVSGNSWLILRRRKPMLGGVLLPMYLSSVGKYRSISLEAEIVERLKEQETRERAETQNQ